MERRIANFEIWTKKQGAEGASCSKCSMKFDRAIARNSHEKKMPPVKFSNGYSGDKYCDTGQGASSKSVSMLSKEIWPLC